MSCQAPDSSEDRSSSHSAALTQKPWTSKARGPVDLLQSRGASDQVIEAARHFQCTACLRYKRPNQVAPSTLRPQAHEVGERLQADVLWITCNTSAMKFPVLSVIDQATGHQAHCGGTTSWRT